MLKSHNSTFNGGTSIADPVLESFNGTINGSTRIVDQVLSHTIVLSMEVPGLQIKCWSPSSHTIVLSMVVLGL